MRFWLPWTKIYLTIVLPVVYSKVDHEWNALAPIKYIECKHPTCKEEGVDIVRSMNKDVEPCNDFFEYVCGNWSQKHIDPNKQYRSFPWSVESTLTYKSFFHIRDSLEEPIDSFEISENKKAKRLYKACMSLPWMPKMKPEEVRSVVEKAGEWPMYPLVNIDNNVNIDWISIHNNYFKLTGESALFGIALKLDPIEGKLPILQIKKTQSPYGLFMRSGSWTVKETVGYLDFLENIGKDVKPLNSIELSRTKLHKSLDEVLLFRIKLQKAASSSDKEKPSTMTIDYLNQWYNEKLLKKSKKVQIPWLSVIQALYENDKNARVTEKAVVLLGYPKYFEQLFGILEKASSRTIVNHMHLYFVERHLRLTREQEDLFYMSRSLIPTEPVAKTRVFPEQWYGCIEKHAMQTAIGKIYVQDYISKITINNMKRLVEDTRHMVLVQIEDAGWLVNETKVNVKEKIEGIRTIVGYPLCYDRPTKKKKDDCAYIFPHIPEGKYDQYSNRIAVTAAYFQTPMYDLSLPFQMNYATMGSLVGHEIYHAIDSAGVTTDIEGKKTKWWSKDMESTYDRKRECFSRQYRRYKIIEFEGYSNAPRKPFRHMTLDEDVCDTMGLKAAYEAYRLKLMKQDHECGSLPHLSEYTCDELFFISFARTFCFAATPRQMMFAARYDDHSTPRLRVNGAVSNMKEFSQAFRCKPNTPLNPRTRCDVWA